MGDRTKKGEGMTVIIAVGNQKGGVGKTTTVLNLSAELAGNGRSVVMVDLDPQSSLTTSIGLKAEATIADVLGDYRPGKVRVSRTLLAVRDRLWLIPSDIGLATAEQGMMQRIGRELLVKRALAPITADYVIVDCPPSLGLLTVNALVAAQWVLVPVQAEYLALRGLALFWQTLQQVEPLNPALRTLGILPTMVRATNHHQRILDTMRANIEARVFGEIPQSIAASEAHAVGRAVSDVAADNAVAEAYRKLAREVERVTR